MVGQSGGWSSSPQRRTLKTESSPLGRPSDDTLRLVLTTSDPAPILALYESGPWEPGAVGRLLSECRQVGEDAWEYEERISHVETVYFLRLEAGGRCRDVSIHWQASPLLALGWREDYRADEAAEALVAGGELARAIAEVAGIKLETE